MTKEELIEIFYERYKRENEESGEAECWRQAISLVEQLDITNAKECIINREGFCSNCGNNSYDDTGGFNLKEKYCIECGCKVVQSIGANDKWLCKQCDAFIVDECRCICQEEEKCN